MAFCALLLPGVAPSSLAWWGGTPPGLALRTRALRGLAPPGVAQVVEPSLLVLAPL
jgi:hypothetical protein